MADVRSTIVWLAGMAVSQRSKYHYTQGPLRMSAVHNPSANPIYADCSAFVTYLYSWAGAPDPNGLNYNGTGYTGTLLSHGHVLSGAGDAQPGDVVIYGAGSGEHVAIITETALNGDHQTVSMGQEGDPNFCRISQDGRQPQRFVRFDTSSQGTPPNPGPAGHRSIKLGDSGLDVCAVQKTLKIPVDGTFGPQTDRAVKAFQTFCHLTADGVVGDSTWQALKL